MSPVTHFLLSWSAASAFSFSKRDRIIVTVAGTVPDADGLGLIWDLLSSRPEHHLLLWSRFHHILCHNVTFALLVACIAWCIASRRMAACAVAFLAFHLHLLCDLLGSRGPDGPWTIPYLLPFSESWDLVWPGQWPLNSWQNFIVTAGAIAFCGYRSWRQGISPLEVFSERASQTLTATLRARFGAPAASRS